MATIVDGLVDRVVKLLLGPLPDAGKVNIGERRLADLEREGQSLIHLTFANAGVLRSIASSSRMGPTPLCLPLADFLERLFLGPVLRLLKVFEALVPGNLRPR